MNKERNGAVYRASVRQIQSYLYTISQADSEVLRVNPDGIYGDQTADAVRSFQKRHSISESGRVDLTTWNALLSEYKRALTLLSEPERISPFSSPLKKRELTVGDRSDTVLILSALLHTLSIENESFAELPISDLFTDQLRTAVQEFQAAHGLETHGRIDIHTWNAIASAYNKYVSYNQ